MLTWQGIRDLLVSWAWLLTWQGITDLMLRQGIPVWYHRLESIRGPCCYSTYEISRTSWLCELRCFVNLGISTYFATSWSITFHELLGFANFGPLPPFFVFVFFPCNILISNINVFILTTRYDTSPHAFPLPPEMHDYPNLVVDDKIMIKLFFTEKT